MLAVVLYVIGALLLLAGGVTLVVGGALVVILPQLIIGGLVLVVGLAIERWRYKPVLDQRPDPRWTDTGERSVDPETGQLIAVYFDPANGERHYLVVPGGANRS
ncbi:MAG TPA: hypothetical protein VFL63_05090 [Rhodanobacteraceae bacterium]|nr:hypothetical protein [Rhodanobacteraceae bacterium]